MDLREFPTEETLKTIGEEARSVLLAIARSAGVNNKVLRVVGEMVGQAYLKGWIERDRTIDWEKWCGLKHDDENAALKEADTPEP